MKFEMKSGLKSGINKFRKSPSSEGNPTSTGNPTTGNPTTGNPTTTGIPFCNRLLIISFLIIFGGISLGSLILKDRSFSEYENRNLQLLPDFSWEKLMNGKYEDLMEDYASDQVIFRDTFYQAKTSADALTGQTLENGVYLCDNCLIRCLEEPDSATRKTLEKSIEAVNTLTANSTVPVTFALIPTAGEIWKDKLPENAPEADEKELIEEIYSQINADTIDMYSAMEEHREEEIYYRTDHHWTSLGAYYGAQTLLQAYGLDAIADDELDRQTVSESFYGTNSSRTGASWVEPDRIEQFVSDEGVTVEVKKSANFEDASLYAPEQLEHRNQYPYFLGGNEPLYRITSEKESTTDQKLLIIRDSYSDALAPFLTTRFAEVHLWDVRYNATSLKEYIEENDIDRVLVLYQLSFFLDGDGITKIAR